MEWNIRFYTIRTSILLKLKLKVINMKKTLIALVVTAMAAASANAVVVYKNEGTKVELDGRGAFEMR